MVPDEACAVKRTCKASLLPMRYLKRYEGKAFAMTLLPLGQSRNRMIDSQSA